MTYTATIFKSGNSYALRVPKNYIEQHGPKAGGKVRLPEPEPEQDIEAIIAAFKQLQEMNAFADIKDPVAWQREIRKDRPLPGRE